MQRYHLKLEYDGGFFSGWQAQAESQRPPGVQSVLEEAVYGFCQERVKCFAAGRTDAGVHALCQHAHFDLTAPRSPETLLRAVNWHLAQKGWSGAVSVLAAQPVSPDFHARFSAKARIYTYLLLARPQPLALEAKRCWHISYPLDKEKMAAAARLLEGQHDFSSFRAASCQSRSPVKTLDRISIAAPQPFHAEEAGGLVWRLKFQARSFLQGQVRALTGALVSAAKGKTSLTELERLLCESDRQLAPPPAPPHGLYLLNVRYDDDAEAKEE